MVKTQNNDAQDFCSSLGWTIPLTWRGREGIHLLDADRRAVLTLSSSYIGGHYPQFTVEIVSKTKGVIARRNFVFDEFLPAGNRSDGRKDYPLGGNTCFEVVEHCGWKWYIAVPSSTEPYCRTVESWINDWR